MALHHTYSASLSTPGPLLPHDHISKCPSCCLEKYHNQYHRKLQRVRTTRDASGVYISLLMTQHCQCKHSASWGASGPVSESTVALSMYRDCMCSFVFPIHAWAFILEWWCAATQYSWSRMEQQHAACTKLGMKCWRYTCGLHACCTQLLHLAPTCAHSGPAPLSIAALQGPHYRNSYVELHPQTACQLTDVNQL